MPKHIELFAGCGGLCLGLESEGLELFFANELSPMAGETFSFNILGENLEEKAKSKKSAKNTLWINSNFPKTDLTSRLKENPYSILPPTVFSELPTTSEELGRKLIVGSIVELNNHLEHHMDLTIELRQMEIDLVSGGPPCQSFSMAGLRQHDNNRNVLPWEFVRLVDMIRPKIAVLENVTGILRAFTIPTDKKHIKYHAWHEVAKAFAEKGYVPVCLHVNAKYAGPAQNRPRFIMFAILEKLFDGLVCDGKLEKVFGNSKYFYNKVQGDPNVSLKVSGLRCWDTDKDGWVFETELFSPFKQYWDVNCDLSNLPHVHTVAEAINDFSCHPSAKVSERYRELLRDAFRFNAPRPLEVDLSPPKNMKHRLNSLKVRQRFRLYQVMANIGVSCPSIQKEISQYLRGLSENLSKEAQNSLLGYSFLKGTAPQEVGRLKKFKRNDTQSLMAYIEGLATKKQTQRALIANQPAPATLSIPDDACHYSERPEDIRTLSVREMARIQSFPDWFEFRSKETTGGQMRKFQVPQYTQVGNAVPPLLGKAIGRVVNKILVKL